MIPYQTEDRARLKRVKAEQAVNLAMQSRWAEAADLNRQLIEAYPKDVEAHNRLGKALMELGQYDEAREAYNHTLRIDSTNTIAQKNLQRIEKLMDEAVPADITTGPVDPSLFIEETGRATTTSLVQVAAADVLAKMNAGDLVNLEIDGNNVIASNGASDVLGRIEPKLRQRLIRLFGMGNKYTAVVTSVDEQSIRIIIRETYRDPAMGNRPSFPVTGDVYRAYTRDSLLRYDADEVDEDDDDDELDDADHEPERDIDVGSGDVLMEEEHAATRIPDNMHDDDEDS
jgi:tetratricopeptide (TPR) repeat protein